MADPHGCLLTGRPGLKIKIRPWDEAGIGPGASSPVGPGRSLLLKLLIVSLPATGLCSLYLVIFLCEPLVGRLIGQYLLHKIPLALSVRQPGAVEIGRSIDDSAHLREGWRFALHTLLFVESLGIQRPSHTQQL